MVLPENAIDDFEHNSLSTYYSGDVSDHEIQTGTVYEGNYALENRSLDASQIYSDPGDGLGEYPSKDALWWYHRGSSDCSGPQFYLRTPNSGSIKFDANVREAELSVSGWGVSDTISQSFPADTWLLNRIRFGWFGTDNINYTIWDGSSTSDTELINKTYTTDGSISDTFSHSSGDYGIEMGDANGDAFWDAITQNNDDGDGGTPEI